MGSGNKRKQRQKAAQAKEKAEKAEKAEKEQAAMVKDAEEGEFVDEYALEDTMADEFFANAGLVRKTIPPDGACLFRAVSDALFHTQSRHIRVRKECCDYVEEHREMFEPFVDYERGFDAYILRMRSPATWGGQIELQALSLMYQVNFSIRSTQNLDEGPSVLDNGFEREVALCFSHGNHYDVLYTSTQMAMAGLCQFLLYELVDEAVDAATSHPEITNPSPTVESNEKSETAQAVREKLGIADMLDEPPSEEEEEVVVQAATETETKNEDETSSKFAYRNVEYEFWLAHKRAMEQQSSNLMRQLYADERDRRWADLFDTSNEDDESGFTTVHNRRGPRKQGPQEVRLSLDGTEMEEVGGKKKKHKNKVQASEKAKRLNLDFGPSGKGRRSKDKRATENVWAELETEESSAKGNGPRMIDGVLVDDDGFPIVDELAFPDQEEALGPVKVDEKVLSFSEMAREKERQRREERKKREEEERKQKEEEERKKKAEEEEKRRNEQGTNRGGGGGRRNNNRSSNNQPKGQWATQKDWSKPGQNGRNNNRSGRGGRNNNNSNNRNSNSRNNGSNYQGDGRRGSNSSNSSGSAGQGQNKNSGNRSGTKPGNVWGKRNPVLAQAAVEEVNKVEQQIKQQDENERKKEEEDREQEADLAPRDDVQEEAEEMSNSNATKAWGGAGSWAAIARK